MGTKYIFIYMNGVLHQVWTYNGIGVSLFIVSGGTPVSDCTAVLLRDNGMLSDIWSLFGNLIFSQSGWQSFGISGGGG